MQNTYPVYNYVYTTWDAHGCTNVREETKCMFLFEILCLHPSTSFGLCVGFLERHCKKRNVLGWILLFQSVQGSIYFDGTAGTTCFKQLFLVYGQCQQLHVFCTEKTTFLMVFSRDNHDVETDVETGQGHQVAKIMYLNMFMNTSIYLYMHAYIYTYTYINSIYIYLFSSVFGSSMLLWQPLSLFWTVVLATRVCFKAAAVSASECFVCKQWGAMLAPGDGCLSHLSQSCCVSISSLCQDNCMILSKFASKLQTASATYILPRSNTRSCRLLRRCRSLLSTRFGNFYFSTEVSYIYIYNFSSFYLYIYM